MSSDDEYDAKTKGNSRKKQKLDQPATQGDSPKLLRKRERDNPEKDAADASSSRVEVLTSSEGDSYIEIGKQKRVTVRKFKGKVLVDIREYYGKSGEEKPGKKGISLSVEQWQALQFASGQVDDLVSQHS